MISVNHLVDQWITQNGAPRRFEPEVRCSVYYARDYLARFGIRLHLHDGRCQILKGRRWKSVRWPEVIGLVDKYRVSEGLQPIKAAQR